MNKWHGVVLALAVLSSGCVKMEQNLILRENGSGSLELNYSIAEQTVGQIDSILKLSRDLESVQGTNAAANVSADLSRLLFSPQKAEILAKLKEYEQFGIVTDKAEIKTRDIRRTVSIKVRFNSLSDLAKTDVFQAYGFSVQKDRNGSYVLSRDPAVQNPAIRPDYSDAETARMVTPLLNGFHVSFSISTPGRIIESTGVSAGPYTTTWLYDFDRNPNAVTALQSQQFRVVFDGAGLKLPELQVPSGSATQSAGGK
jgi:hypothetical protein